MGQLWSVVTAVVFIMFLTVRTAAAFCLSVPMTDAKIASAQTVEIAGPATARRQRRVVGIRLAAPARSIIWFEFVRWPNNRMQRRRRGAFPCHVSERVVRSTHSRLLADPER